MNGRISKNKHGANRSVTSGRKMNIPVHDCFFANDDGVAFEMTESISLSAMEKDSSEPHRHPFYEILYVEKANGRHTIDHKSYEEIEDKVFLICPGQVHCWEDVSSINGMLLYFNEDFLTDSTLSVNAIWELNLLREMGGHGVSLSENERIHMDELIRLMYREFKHKSHEYASVIRSYLNIFLIHLFRVYQKAATGFWPQQRTTSLLENFQKLVRSHVTERRTVKFYADRLGVSMGYLNEQVKTQLGVRPSAVIKRAAVDEAKRLIANTNLSMTEIALSMGFTDGSYFCRMFKNEMGMSPLQFKKNCLRNTMRA